MYSTRILRAEPGRKSCIPRSIRIVTADTRTMSRCVTALKGLTPSQDYIADSFGDSCVDQLHYDISTPFAPGSPSRSRSNQHINPVPHSPHSQHVQYGTLRKERPWVPPFMRSPASSPFSPGVDGVAHTSPEMLRRTGGGFVQKGTKTQSCRGEFWGPSLGSPPRRPHGKTRLPPRERGLPSPAERALWMTSEQHPEMFPRSMGLNSRDLYDRPREHVYLLSPEADALFSEHLPMAADCSEVKVISANKSGLQFPIRRPFTSKDLYRLYQCVSGEQACIM